ncbi:NAD(+)/NADH kinase [Actinoplanes nipponensis]|uniref:NAD(+)/NADH kinase n=1 Tax=Actinoplanes nipponensis TaxID=135950 RepID=UPI00366DDB1C
MARAQDRERIGAILDRSTDPDSGPGGVDVVGDPAFVAAVDGVIALGGDGTMLGAMRLMTGRAVPVLGVNHGNLGFLVEVSPPDLEAALAHLVAGDFTVEARSCLVADTPGTPLATRYGFNDVVLARMGRTGAVSVDLTVNGQRYGYYKCDALVVSTSSGSTAYNYAAGGPVLSPSAAAIVVTPVAPMAGIGRSVVLGAGDRIGLHVAGDSTRVAVDIDGTAAAELTPGETLTAVLREDAAQVVRLAAGTHGDRSRVKLSLLDLPLRRDQLLDLIPEEIRRRITGADG